MRILTLCLAVSAALGAASAPRAHEFWIEPTAYQIAPDGILEGHLVNGQYFEGALQSYLPRRFARFDMALGDRVAPVEGRLGDKPALDTAPLGDGLHVIAYESQGLVVRYTEFEKFLSFAEHKDFGDVELAHRAAGYPTDRFGEAYTRYAKALVGVGAAQGADRHLGLATEIVALRNPYTDDLSEGLPVQVFYGDEVRPDVQVEQFEKAPDGTVEITLHRTDGDGIAVLPVRPGHAYLIDAVVLRTPAAALAEEKDVVWETLWASLVLAVPEDEG